jgi:hypothetical protein
MQTVNSDDDQFSAGDQFGFGRLRGVGFRFGRPGAAGE